MPVWLSLVCQAFCGIGFWAWYRLGKQRGFAEGLKEGDARAWRAMTDYAVRLEVERRRANTN